MKYIITGKIIDTDQMVSPGQLTQIFKRGIILNLEAYNKLGFYGKISINGELNKSRAGVAIVEGNSSKELNRVLDSFPKWCQVKWSVTPIKNV